MARSIPADRLSRLIQAASETFIALGYRRAQMSDVAEALGVAKGTLYLYVESKDALFDAALRFADGHHPLPSHDELPLKDPPPDAAVEYLRERLVEETRDLALLAAVSAGPGQDAEAELSAVIGDLYARAYRNRRGIKLADRCAVDYPALAAVWFGEGRWAQHALFVEFLEQRIRAGKLCPVPSVPVTARLLLESVAFWAVHRHWDPAPQPVPEGEVLPALTALFSRGLLGGERARPSPRRGR